MLRLDCVCVALVLRWYAAGRSPGASFATLQVRDVSLDGHAHAGASRTWVGRDLLVRRDERLLCPDLEYRNVTTDAHRKFRRTDASLAHLDKDMLHDPVLTRVVGDDADPTAGIRPTNRPDDGLPQERRPLRSLQAGGSSRWDGAPSRGRLPARCAGQSSRHCICAGSG